MLAANDLVHCPGSRRSTRRCSPSLRPERGGAHVSERRHREPLPLGGEDGLPYSKGLLARALIATGVPAERRTSSR